MSTLLYRLGRTAFGRPWPVLTGWALVLAGVLAALAINGVSVSSELKIEGTPAQRVLDRVSEEVPEASGGQASVVFTAPEGERLDTPERLTAIAATVQDVYALDQVIDPAAVAAPGDAGAPAPGDGSEASRAETPPYQSLVVDGAPVPGVLVSADGQVALFQFQLTVPYTSLTDAQVNTVLGVVEDAESGTGLTALPSETLQPFEVPVGPAEVVGIAVAAVVLVLALGSLVAAGLPLVTALVGVGIGVGGAYALSGVVEMNSITPVLGLMIGLAVGIDYALFVVNRQRRLILDGGLDAREAAARAVGTAGSAVFFAGMTVIVALIALIVIGITLLTTMALVAGATVLLAVLIALSLLPALLGLVGERICTARARERRRARIEAESHSVADRWVKGVIRFRWLVVGGVVAILGVAAVPAASMDLGIPTGATADRDTAARQSYDAISGGFGEGFNGPLLVTAEPAGPAEGVPPQTIGRLVRDLQQYEGIATVSPVGASEAGDFVVFSVVPTTGPDDEATADLVEALRSDESGIAQQHAVNLGVTGLTAINIDLSEKLAGVTPVYLTIIAVLSMLILLLVFRSVVVPIQATAAFLLSILATFGATTAVFSWGWLSGVFGVDTGGPLVSFLPIMVTGILYGLAMDYQVFLVSSMRDAHVHGYRGVRSVVNGFDQASRVVVAAAVIMISVFSGFIFSHDIMIKQFGFALAFGILVDAFVVRMTLVPAIMAIFGERTWWLPRWLDRLLPNLDIEGDRLLA
ncbi:MAG: MMPL family transporter, partial [Actinomycetota bacterium]